MSGVDLIYGSIVAGLFVIPFLIISLKSRTFVEFNSRKLVRALNISLIFLAIFSATLMILMKIVDNNPDDINSKNDWVSVLYYVGVAYLFIAFTFYCPIVLLLNTGSIAAWIVKKTGGRKKTN